MGNTNEKSTARVDGRYSNDQYGGTGKESYTQFTASACIDHEYLIQL